MPSRTRRRIAEALALTGAAALVGASLTLGGAIDQTGSPEQIAASADGVGGVVVVDAADGSRAAADFRAVPSAALPGDVLVLSASARCPAVQSARAKTAAAVLRQAECAGGPADPAARTTALREAADRAGGDSGELVLVGSGWGATAPLEVADPNSDQALGLSVFAAGAAGELPDLHGRDVVIVGPSPDPAVKRVWDAYLTAAGAESVLWIAR